MLDSFLIHATTSFRATTQDVDKKVRISFFAVSTATELRRILLFCHEPLFLSSKFFVLSITDEVPIIEAIATAQHAEWLLIVPRSNVHSKTLQCYFCRK
ncbi:MAG: hypothetical protein AAFQ57_06615 [Cyanobacteria bacterium J06626_14]